MNCNVWLPDENVHSSSQGAIARHTTNPSNDVSRHQCLNTAILRSNFCLSPLS